MINNNKTADYIDSLIPGNSRIIEEIRAEAVALDMPVIRRDGEQLLKSVLKIKNPQRILEVGTCVGYSAIVMASVTDESCYIDTLEIGRADYETALVNIDRAGYSGRITCILCDASDRLKEYAGSGAEYDFIFMDAAKGQYINWLPYITGILKPGGVLLSDNVFYGGCVAESRFAVERRDRTTHARMRKYLFELTHSDIYTTSIVNVADGMSISVKNNLRTETQLL